MHDYSKVLTTSTTGIAGGLRVSKITKIDNAGHQEITDYYYVTGYTAGADPLTLTSSGVLDVIPQYDFSNFSGIDNFNHPFVEGLLSSNPVIPLSLTTSGRYIGYSEVVEKRSDGAYTIYKFTNHDNGYADVPAVKTYNRTYVPYMPSSSRDFERGKTLGKFVYDNTGKSIQSEEYEYDRLGTSGARNVQQDYGNLCSETESRIYTSRAAYYLYYYPFVVKKITSKNYQTGTGTNYTTTVQDFTYENKLVKTTITTNSKGQQLKAENFYPWNFSDPPIYPEMVARNMLDYVVQTDQSKASQLKKRTKIDYGMWPQWPNGGIYPYAVKEQIENNPLVTLVQVNDFDAKGNILSQTPKSGIKESFLWGYNQYYLVGKVINADISDIAYTSFEINDNSAWNIPKVPSADYNAPTGRKVFSLSMGTISKSDLDPAKTYIVSYWSKNGTQDVNGTSGTAGRTVSGYTYYEHKIINPVNGLISVSGTGTIDELRLYPQGALISTYTYEPLIGMSSQCDANNRITYYEYDAFGRLMLIRDQDKNILKKVCYNYDGHTENCAINYYYNTLQSAIFTPTCPPGYTGTSNTPVTYTVPANVYSSTISVDAANQMALAEIATYGQVYANTFTVCHQNVTVQFEFDLVSWYDDGYTYIENWDCWLRFYDPSYLWETIEIFEPLNIHYTITSTYGGTQHFYITAPANTREYYLGYFSEAIYSDPYYYNALQFNVVSWSW
jgi:YD repeat-containing protein